MTGVDALWAAWALRRVRVERLGPAPSALELHTDGRGRWTDASSGATLPLPGCLDVDICPSPFTNSLPIRRLAAIPREPVALDVALVALPDLAVHAARREYTRIERRDDGARWRFRSLDSDFAAELPVDRDGLVLDYPGIARRLR